MMTKIWGGMIILSVVCGALTGRMSEVSTAAVEGANSAVQLILSIIGIMCFWSGIMEIMQASGLAKKISMLIRPVLRPLFGKIAEDGEAAEYLSANITANLLGLSNAATPIGLKAAARIHELSGGGKSASNPLIMLVVLNTASLQLIPTTVAALRASLGAAAPFEIIPSVWAASALSVGSGLLMAWFLGKKNPQKLSVTKRGPRP